MNISICHANSVLKLSQPPPAPPHHQKKTFLITQSKLHIQGQATAVLKTFRTFKALRKKLLKCTILVKANVCLENSFLIVHNYTACFSYILN